MSALKTALSNILYGYETCALCFQSVDTNFVEIDDSIVLMKEDGVDIVSFSTMISSMMGESILTGYSNMTSKLCDSCANSAFGSYRFIHRCRRARETLTNTIDKIHNCISDTPDNGINTWYISADVSRATAEKFHDTCDNVDSLKMALKRFKMLKHWNVMELETNIDSFSHSDDDDDMRCSSEDPLNTANKYTHPIVTPCICDVCGKTFINESNLIIHAYNNHSIVNAKVIHGLNSQQCINSKPWGPQKDKKFFCDICGKGFISKSYLTFHIQTKHLNTKINECKKCGKTFASKSGLRMHMIKHTRIRNFKCKICSKKFVTKPALVYHMRIHTGERPYPCNYCEKRFLSTSRRAEHVRYNHMAPTMQCDICDSQFKKSSALTRHRRRHFDPLSKLYKENISENCEV
ncbi:unnamed protein product [Plutella xylostella]|uniref:(diamondback moth) hypothetical protein n=1 Tax=Plutella xylostella TaxID=51655 RepID=A0A8S4G0B5_PLUXY|nr:unnamed protein product [Plutella xylostella]